MVEKKAPSWEKQFEERMRIFEKKMEAMGKKLEEKGETYGKEFEDKTRTLQSKMHRNVQGSHRIFWGSVLVIVGLVWLGNNLGWFHYSVPLVPVGMIALGIFLILRHREFSEDNHGKRNQRPASGGKVRKS